MALNLNLLRSFWMVAGCGSVSGAAQQHFISQPALSKAISELERQAGLPLLERGARGVRLTEAGQTLYEHAKAIFALEQSAEDALQAHRNLDCSTLRIGASTTISTYVLPPLLAAFRQRHPGLTLKIARENTRQIEALLIAYQLDVALVEGPVHDPRITATPWREEELVLVCCPTHPLVGRSRVTTRDLQRCDWLVREKGSGTREVVESVLRDYGLPPENALEIGGAEALKQSAAAGLGVAVVSLEAARDQIALGKLCAVKVSGLKMHRRFWMLHLQNRPVSLAAAAFEMFLRESASTKNIKAGAA